MPDHLHQVIRAARPRQTAVFVQTVTRLFALEWNRVRGRKGPLFRHSFGSAAKLGEKQVRTALAYCNNNPVERKLSHRAEDYRWTFLRYGETPHPYSAPLNISRCSAGLKAALTEARRQRAEGDWVHYGQLRRWERTLTTLEWMQLVDELVAMWNIIDYDAAAAYYGSFPAMLRAFGDNTGSEYDIREQRDPYSDAVYADCTRVLLQEGLVRDPGRIPVLPPEQKARCYRLLRRRTAARPGQIGKFLHWQELAQEALG